MSAVALACTFACDADQRRPDDVADVGAPQPYQAHCPGPRSHRRPVLLPVDQSASTRTALVVGEMVDGKQSASAFGVALTAGPVRARRVRVHSDSHGDRVAVAVDALRPPTVLWLPASH